MPNYKDYLELNLIILLNSFIPRIFIEISVPSSEIVFIRTVTAMVILGGYIYFAKVPNQTTDYQKIKLLLTGLLTSLYWILLSDAAKSSNSSVTLVGMATTSLWVSFINIFMSRRRPEFFQLAAGLAAACGVYIIYNSSFEYDFGFSIAILAAAVGGLLTVLNAGLAKTINHYVVTFYQMIGAAIGTSIFLPFYYYTHPETNFEPSSFDIILILGLAFIFSIYSYSVFIKVMKRISAFVVALTANLSPVYGILIAYFLYSSEEQMDASFYLGTGVIILSVFAYPFIESRKKKKAERASQS